MRILVEGAVIVGSILLAFGIDAAWDGRAERQRRDAMLVALAGDMALAKDEIDRVAGYHSIGRSVAEDLLSYGEVAGGEEARFVVDSLVGALSYAAASYDAPLGAVGSLINSGDLELLNDPALAADLTAFPALVADLDREQSFIARAVADLAVYLGSEGVDVTHLATEVPWQTSRTEAFALLESPRFRGIIGDFYFSYRNTLSGLVSIREALARIESRLPVS